MKIFVDRHHEALWHSFILLFENRLGHKLYHPWGMDWFPDHWAIARPYNNNLGTAKQFLEGVPPEDGTQTLHPTRGITLEEFKQTKFDILIASYWDHIDIYADLIKKYQPQAKLIAHYGNEWPWHPRAKNYMCSTASIKHKSQVNNITDNYNRVYYHQEFNTDLFKPVDKTRLEICSFVNALNINSIFKQDWQDFLMFEKLLNQEDDVPIPCYSFGGGCRDGSLTYPVDVAKRMRQSAFGFHLKTGGDGYGHVIHNWMACGRPVIYRGSQYRGKMAGELLKHMETGIDVDKVGIKGAAFIVRDILTGEKTMAKYKQMRQLIRFNDIVNFDEEEQTIRFFLGELI